MAMEPIPIYIVTGFLESGKTTMVKEMLTDEYFTERRAHCCCMVCEDGEEEYGEELLKSANTVKIDVEDIESIENGLMNELEKQV